MEDILFVSDPRLFAFDTDNTSHRVYFGDLSVQTKDEIFGKYSLEIRILDLPKINILAKFIQVAVKAAPNFNSYIVKFCSTSPRQADIFLVKHFTEFMQMMVQVGIVEKIVFDNFSFTEAGKELCELRNLENLVSLSFNRNCVLSPKEYHNLTESLAKMGNLRNLDLCSVDLGCDLHAGFNNTATNTMRKKIHFAAPKLIARKLNSFDSFKYDHVDLDISTASQSFRDVNRNELYLCKALSLPMLNIVKLCFACYDFIKQDFALTYFPRIVAVLENTLQELSFFRCCFDPQQLKLFFWLYLRSQDEFPEQMIHRLNWTNSTGFFIYDKLTYMENFLRANKTIRHVKLDVVEVYYAADPDTIKRLKNAAEANPIILTHEIEGRPN